MTTILKLRLPLLFILCCTHFIQAQYEFKPVQSVDCTSVKSQDRTGTCWSFASSSFLESEIIKNGFGAVNLSEMYVVRNIYKQKAKNYVLRQGKANFSQGGLAHDLLNSIDQYGLVPESIYNGLSPNERKHNHTELVNAMKGFLDGVIKAKPISQKWPFALEGILDAYLGEVPQTFKINGQQYTPQTYAKHLQIDAADYIHLTSFTHHAFYQSFILEIPDNFSNGAYLNIPINEMLAVVDTALARGYSITWDGDVSEKGFKAKKGLAIIPLNPNRGDAFQNPGKEILVSQERRQLGFESLKTTDDHLMHIIGSAKDQRGTSYYLIKNSWGAISPFEGKLYMSESYLGLKTISITLHKNALTDEMKKKLNIY